ncbi:hypothetical protein GOBAR_AA21031 [Gossypium barbadense]|uniref:Uncharacterized protein n=1 Tax=Gossypium barbadense TaxID=3634 RepID=A0A2P5X8I7_GOSBA|nr:hypothetical protein GOBAR_AA21031 [Gossypium barbadense]
MLSKFISVLETYFQNIEIAFKNQQASIQGLKTQIGQLSKLISERPQGSLPSNMKLNMREHLNAISTQDKEEFIAPEPELQQNNAMNKGRKEVNDNEPIKEPSQTKTTETVHYYHEKNKDVHEERRLRIEELDEWREHKSRTHDKPKLCQNKPEPNQLKVGDKVLLDAVDPHIVTTTPNEEIPLTVLNIFPYGTVEVSHPKFDTFKHTLPGTRVCLKSWPNRGRDTAVRDGRVEAGHDFPKTRGAINSHGRMTWPWVNLIGRTRAWDGKHGRARDKARFCFFDKCVRHGRAIQPCTTIHGRGARRLRSLSQKDVGDRVLPRYVLQLKFGTHSLNLHKLRRRSYFRYSTHDPSPQVVMMNNDDTGTIHFQLGGLVHAMSVPELGIALGLSLTLDYALLFILQVVMMNNDDTGTIHFQLGGLVHAMSVPELGIALGLYTDEFMEEKDMNALPGNIHISPSLCWKALAPISYTYDPSRSKASALPPSLRYLHAILAHTLTGRRESQMSPQGITTMLHMRMIERRRGTDPPQYRLSHAIDEEDLEDIPDDVLAQHEEPSIAPPRE